MKSCQLISRFCLFLFLTVILITAHTQEMMIPVTLSARVKQSTQVVEGKVIAQNSYWNEAHTLILTASTIEIFKVFKGNTLSTLTVETVGGRVGMDLLVAEPELNLQVGEAGIFLLKPGTGGSAMRLKMYQAVASTQGFIKYDVVNRSATDVFHQYPNINSELYGRLQAETGAGFRQVKAYNEISAAQKTLAVLAPPVIDNFSPAAITAGTFSVLTINGNNFGASYTGPASVAFRNANDGGASYSAVPAGNIVAWSNTQIQVIVPSQAGTGTVRVLNSGAEVGISTATITITYNQLNVAYNPGTGVAYYEPNLINRSGTGGYRYQYSTATAGNGVSFDGDAPAKARFESAMQTWRCETGLNFTSSGNTAVQNVANDGVFLVGYDHDAAPLGTGVLGVAYSFYSGCSVGPNFYWFVNDIDIIFKRNGTDVPVVTWYYGSDATAQPAGTCDFETVALHELGHHHQLGHIISPGAVMHYAITIGTNNRVLSAARDVAGGDYVMSHSTLFNNCGRTAMTAAVCGPEADFTGNPTTTCGTSLTVNFTDVSTNTPTSWNWSFPGGTPSSSTLQNPSVTYSASGQYSVTLTSANASGSDAVTKTNLIDIGSTSTATAYNFEGTLASAGILLNNTDNATTWQQRDVTGSTGGLTKAAYMDHYDYSININTTDELVLPKYNLASGNYELKFDLAYARYDAANFDGLQLLLSTDCGITYPAVLYSASGAALATTADMTAEFVPTGAAQWRTETIDLSSYAGQVVKLKFVAYNGYGNNLYIDNVQLSTIAPLPVRMIDFKAVVTENQQVQLMWSTTSEYNSRHFELERSLAGTDQWTDIATIAAAGNSNTLRQYGYTDAGLRPGTFEYRIRQVDLDNSARFSPVARVSIRANASPYLVYPNPAKGHTYISATHSDQKNITVSIMDSHGKTLLHRTTIISLASPFKVDLQHLRKGIYFIQIQSDGSITTEKLVVQ